MPENLFQKINSEQKKAVEFGEGPLLIIAGAGTGKTTVLTYRFFHLINSKKANPDEILALTFTDKAAEEFEERIDKLLPFGYYDLWISTFHSFGERILKEWGLEIGIPPNFKLIDQTGSWLLIRKNFSQFNFLDYYKPLGNPTKFIHALVSHFTRLKDEGIYPENYLEYADSLKLNLDDIPTSSKSIKRSNKLEILKEQENYQRIKEVAQAYHTYQRLLLENDTLDFGDLINFTIKLFEKRPGILEKYRNQFKYILADEFQDTNFSQYKLIKLLAHPKNNITVCLDDDQSIFSFQGSSFNNVLQFKKDFPRAQEVVLTKNYRSSQNILDLAYKFIQLNNPNRLEYQLNQVEAIKKDAEKKGIKINNFKKINKKLKSALNQKGTIELLTYKTAEEEVAGVINKIIEIKEKNKEASFSDFAILCRTNETANIFSQALERANLPYQFVASKGLYLKPLIIEIISYFKILLDLYDSASFYKVLGIKSFQIPNEDISKIAFLSKKKSASIYEILNQLPLASSFSKKTINSVNYLLSLIKTHSELAKNIKVSELFVKILDDLGYFKYLAKKEDEGHQELQLLVQFHQKLKNFEENNIDGRLASFLEEFQMEIDSGEEGNLKSSYQEGPESVKVMTIHSAKGLEFNYVFLVNLIDKRFPTITRKELIEIPKNLVKEVLPQGDFHLQEERRLFYVGMTRAKKRLYFTWAKDYGGKTKRKPSRFLFESGLIQKREDKEKEIQTERYFAFQKTPSILKIAAKEKLPPYFSFTQLAVFKKCPLQYKFAHILKIPVRGNPSFSFGKTIHNTLYRFVNLAAKEMQAEQSNLFDNKKISKKLKISLDDLLKIYEEEWLDEWYDDQSQKKKYFKKGKEVLKEFFDIFLKNHPTILFLNSVPALEKDFSFKIENNIFKGKIDRIDKTREGKIEIIDYKTGKSPIGEKLEPDDKLQLLIYQLAAKEVFGLNSPKLTYSYLESGQNISFFPQENELEKTRIELKKRISEIKNSDFSPTPGWQCHYCDFKEICPYRKINNI